MGYWVLTCYIEYFTCSIQEMDMKIVMSTTFYIIKMPTTRPFIRYNVDEVVDVNDEIIK